MLNLQADVWTIVIKMNTHSMSQVIEYTHIQLDATWRGL